MRTTGAMRVFSALGALLLIALTALAQGGGAPVSGLELALSVDQSNAVPSKIPKFRIEFRNVGADDLILNVGIMLANGKKQYPNAVALMLTDSQQRSRVLVLREPGFIAGRMDPWVLPLSVGSTFSIPVDLDKYWAAPTHEFDYKLRPGAYSLQAQFTGKRVTQTNLDTKGIALMPYWEGTIASNQVRFEVPSQ